MGVAFFLLRVEKPLGAGAAGFVDRDQRARRELVLFGDTSNQPRHLIGAAAGACRDDELNGSGRHPGRRGATNSSSQWTNHKRRDELERADDFSHIYPCRSGQKFCHHALMITLLCGR